ncbi:MAG: thiol-activated cytolysin family protein, partial [Spirochaetota bacterium]
LLKIAVCAASFILLACPGPSSSEPKKLTELERIFSGKPSLVKSDPMPKTQVGKPETTTKDASDSKGNKIGKQVCTTTKYKAAPEYNELLMMDPKTDVMFPGAIIASNSIEDGSYELLFSSTGYRKPLGFSASLQNIDGSPVGRMESPKLSEFRAARNKILSSELTGDVPANVTFEHKSVYTKEEFGLELGANYTYTGGFTANVNALVNFDTSVETNHILIKFFQKYYTIDIDVPGAAEDLINADAVSESYKKRLREMNSDAEYISSITYGRMALFSVTSKDSVQTLKAQIDASFSSATQEGGGHIDTNHHKELRAATIKGTIIGGSSADAAAAIDGFDSMIEYIKKGGRYTKDTPGAPLVVKMRNLRTHRITRFVKATEYNIVNCVTQKDQEILQASVRKIKVITNAESGALELYGMIDIDVIDSKTGKAVEGRQYYASDGRAAWVDTEDSPTEISNAKNYDATQQRVVHKVPINGDESKYDQYKIRIYTDELWEDDDSGDDRFTNYSKDVFTLRQIREGRRTHTFRVSGDGNELEITVEVGWGTFPKDYTPESWKS